MKAAKKEVTYRNEREKSRKEEIVLKLQSNDAKEEKLRQHFKNIIRSKKEDQKSKPS